MKLTHIHQEVIRPRNDPLRLFVAGLIVCLGVSLETEIVLAAQGQLAANDDLGTKSVSPIFPGGAAAEEEGSTIDGRKWICVAEAATGFEYVNEKWKAASFDVGDNRYIVGQHKQSESNELPQNLDELREKLLGNSGGFYITKFGEEYSTLCEKDSPNVLGMIICNRNTRKSPYDADTVRFDTKGLMYIRIVSYGFLKPEYAPLTPYGSLMPSIEIGKCSLL